MWKGELPDAAIADIVERCEKQPSLDGIIEGDSSPLKNNSVRKSTVRWVNKDQGLRDLIWECGTIANSSSFGFDIVNKFDIQHTTYYGKGNDHYDWHEDNCWINEKFYDRKLSLIIQLSDPSEYTGGKFEFEINGKIVTPEGFEEKGSILVFPSFIRHRVNPVTKGTRQSIVSWIEGPAFR